MTVSIWVVMRFDAAAGGAGPVIAYGNRIEAQNDADLSNQDEELEEGVEFFILEVPLYLPDLNRTLESKVKD